MADYTYSPRDIDKPDTLIGYLGSHWDSAFANTFQIRSLMRARGRLEYQKVLRLLEAERSVSRLNADTLHTDHWFLLTLIESDRNNAAVSTLLYGEGAVYGNDPETGFEYQYGVPVGLRSAFPAPSKLREAPYIMNRMSRPSAVLTNGLDYFLDLDHGAIVFRDNPFDNDLFPKDTVYKDGEAVDREIRMWVFRAQFDEDLIYKHFGYVVGVDLETSETYQDYVNAIWDSAVEGTGGKQIEEAFAALTDTPIAQGTEVVEHVVEDDRHLLVLTDKTAYKFPKSASAVVSVGDTVQAGDQLVDTVQIFEFHDGEVPDVSDLSAISLDRNFLLDNFSGGITFNNTTATLEVDTSGIFTRIEFDIGGFPGDTEEFWDLFHSRGIADPPTLAQLLDQRSNKVGEPVASNLPATINPLEFLIQNVLRNNAFVVKIKASQQGENALPLASARQLRKIVPPHTAMIVVMELDITEDEIIMDGSGSETVPGFEEDPELGPALEPFTEEVIDPDTFVSEQPSLKYSTGVCL